MRYFKKRLRFISKAFFCYFRVTTNQDVTGNVTENVTEIMGITFHFTLDSYVQADGTQKIMLRITQNRTHKYVQVGYSVKAQDWNKEKKEVRKSHKLAAQINMAMQAKLLEVQKEYLKGRAESRPVTAGELQRKLKKEILGDSFINFARKRILNMPSPKTQDMQTAVINKLVEYLKGKDLIFPEVNYDFLKAYERHLKNIGNGTNTIHANMKTLRAIYNEAIRGRHYRPSDPVSPFHEYKAKKVKSKRTRLKLEDIIRIENLVVRPGIRRYDAKNAFLFSYYTQGMRVGDLLQLRWRDIKGQYIYYEAGKTEKARPRKLIQKALAILDYYRKPNQKPDDYIFPFLQGKSQRTHTAKEWSDLIDAKNAIIRKELMDIAHELGFEKLSMHVARHSFANIARQITGDIHIISDALDHSSIAITEGYFADAEPEENDELVRKVFGE